MVHNCKYSIITYQVNGRKSKTWVHSRMVYIKNPLTGKLQVVKLSIGPNDDHKIKYSYYHSHT